jgi:hypothetical protein
MSFACHKAKPYPRPHQKQIGQKPISQAPSCFVDAFKRDTLRNGKKEAGSAEKTLAGEGATVAAEVRDQVT